VSEADRVIDYIDRESTSAGIRPRLFRPELDAEGLISRFGAWLKHERTVSDSGTFSAEESVRC
jgi:hypothetical protein